MSKHTPGPWTVGEDEYGVAVVESLDGMTLCEVYPYAGPDYRELLPGNAGEANAQLMAAAPELKQQRDELLWTLEYVQGELSEWDATPFLPEVLRVINSVIDKARKEKS